MRFKEFLTEGWFDFFSSKSGLTEKEFSLTDIYFGPSRDGSGVEIKVICQLPIAHNTNVQFNILSSKKEFSLNTWLNGTAIDVMKKGLARAIVSDTIPISVSALNNKFSNWWNNITNGLLVANLKRVEGRPNTAKISDLKLLVRWEPPVAQANET